MATNHIVWLVYWINSDGHAIPDVSFLTEEQAIQRAKEQNEQYPHTKHYVEKTAAYF